MPDYNYKPPSWWNLPEKCCYLCEYWGSGHKRRVHSSHCLHNVLKVRRPNGGEDERTAVTMRDDVCDEFSSIIPPDRKEFTIKNDQEVK